MNTQNPSVFQFQQSATVRVLVIDNEPWFCLRDVSSILDIKIASPERFGLDEKGVTKNVIPTQSGNQTVTFISEPNLYRVIFRSNKPEAKNFQDWVFNEVLPSIRKTGAYVAPVAKPDQAKPFTEEYITHAQYHELTHIVWAIGQSFHQSNSAEHYAWKGLREQFGITHSAKLPARQHADAAAYLKQLEADAYRIKLIFIEAEKRVFKSLFQLSDIEVENLMALDQAALPKA